MRRKQVFLFLKVWLRKGIVIIHLVGQGRPDRIGQVYPGQPDELSCGYRSHITFEVADLKAALRYLRTHNIEIVGGPRPRGDSVTQFALF